MEVRTEKRPDAKRVSTFLATWADLDDDRDEVYTLYLCDNPAPTIQDSVRVKAIDTGHGSIHGMVKEAVQMYCRRWPSIRLVIIDVGMEEIPAWVGEAAEWLDVAVVWFSTREVE